MAGKKQIRVVVIGAGMSGILCGIRLREGGVDDFTIYEKADQPGGTWRDNTYPGLSCDVPSHVYCYSFEPNPEWSHLFSPGAEIYSYFEKLVKKYGVDRNIRYGEEVTRCEFAGGRWQIETRSGTRDSADVVIASTGVLHHPHIPEFEGLGTFEGELFHSSRWNHDAPLDGCRLGVVGTGSTAVQIVGAVVDRVKKLSLFQRTAQWIFPQVNPAYSEEDKQSFRDDPSITKNMYQVMSQAFEDTFSNAVIDADSEQIKIIQEACRANLEQNVLDAELLRKLTPDYRAACKRLVIAEHFYDAIQKPNAELVTEEIDKIEPRGIRTADGRLHELDILVLATGFRTHDFMRPMTVIGRDDVRLNDVWAKATPAYRSVSIPGFPNYFMLIGPNSPIGNFSLTEIAELQFDYVMQLIDQLRTGECREISATTEATTRFNEDLAEASKSTIWATGCRSWYLDANGVPAAWPWTLKRFRREMGAPNFADYERI